ncbi:hypothetical protein ASESINO_84 [Erwinia phage vB_EamM_Asesino]|uniref:Uncharacterized protein n=1 Tax=Erwinia phage vB_EamM_Asesino TaxID=1883370 RepID=A0A1B2IA01_9CAUD|nr:hypothetical protein ASESINO_84 [Erwinia phage vB_EamM_Asesino]ANZ48097.1 hypothetical protein ASESINO_84 [Erwinia phage vB_EamM_Asesino]
MISRKHKLAIYSIAVAVLVTVGMMTVNNDYNTCRANGNSVAMCTGRG